MNLLKNTIIMSAIFAALATSVQCFAEETSSEQTRGAHAYFGLRAGNTNYSVDESGFDFDNAANVSPFIGVSIPFNSVVALNFDAEYFVNTKSDMSYRSRNVGEVKLQGFFVNSYLQFNPQGIVSPYFGIGFGHSKADFDFSNNFSGSASDSSGSYQSTVGLQFNCSDHFAFDTSVRYMAYASDVSALNINGGIKISF